MTSPGMNVVATADPTAVDLAVAALRADEAVLVPTDTVYGLAALPTATGLDRLFALKDRPPERSIAILVASADQVADIAVASTRDRQLMDAFWPGPLTLVLPRLETEVAYGAADGTVGVRCPNHEFVRSLAESVGPLAVTSANRSGQPTPLEAVDAARDLAGVVPVVVDDGPCEGMPSSVVRCDPSTIHMFRQGSLDLDTLNAALGAGLS